MSADVAKRAAAEVEDIPEEANLDGDGFDELFANEGVRSGIEKDDLRAILPPIDGTENRAEKSAALRDALKAMAREESSAALSDDDLAAMRDFFLALYGGRTGYRHEYSMLSEMMYELLENADQRNVDLADHLPYEINALADNMSRIRVYLEKDEGDSVDKGCLPEGVIESVQKLDDHIELEFQRMKYQVKQNAALHESIGNVTDDFATSVNETKGALTQSFESAIGEAITKSSKEMAEVKSGFEQDVKEAEARSQRNYVSVLGIFISLVISFSAGIRLSSEAVQTLSEMGTYRFAAVLAIIVFGMFDLILTLLYFVLSVSEIDGGGKKGLRIIGIFSNIVFLLLLVAIIIARLLHLFG